jgi:hypothetical protein
MAIKNTVGDAADTAVSKVSDKVSETATQVKDKVDANRNVAAQGLEQAASTIREKADSLPGGETVTGLAHTAADKLSATAGYVKRDRRQHHDGRCGNAREEQPRPRPDGRRRGRLSRRTSL